MTERPFNVLFLCTGNSARSIMAEAIINRDGRGHFTGYSAGSRPAGFVHPYVVDLLKRNNYPVHTLRSKDWSEFAGADVPAFDFAFTVCDKAAGETCPVWPGQPMTAHWGFPDPAAFEGTEAETRAHFAEVFRQIFTRISIFTQLPIQSLSRIALQRRLDDLGRSRVGKDDRVRERGGAA